GKDLALARLGMNNDKTITNAVSNKLNFFKNIASLCMFLTYLTLAFLTNNSKFNRGICNIYVF
ncbi:hypothetical protein, partial [Bacillus mycoides]|uniref:hypothetical protein n=1 Tax=Bacillus mycoides TaxID=1405 RepID=UPI0019550F7A